MQPEPFELRIRGQCPIHSLERAVDVCARCGCFVCRICVSSIAGTVVCASCAHRPRPVPGVPPRMWIALALACVGVVIAPLGLVAYVMMLREGSLLKRGLAPEASRGWIPVVRGIASIGAVLTLVLVVTLGIFLFAVLRGAE